MNVAILPLRFTSHVLLVASFIGTLGAAALAQVMPPPVEPVITHPLVLMDVPGLPPRSLLGGLPVDFSPPPPEVPVIQRLRITRAMRSRPQAMRRARAQTQRLAPRGHYLYYTAAPAATRVVYVRPRRVLYRTAYVYPRRAFVRRAAYRTAYAYPHR